MPFIAAPTLRFDAARDSCCHCLYLLLPHLIRAYNELLALIFIACVAAAWTESHYDGCPLANIPAPKGSAPTDGEPVADDAAITRGVSYDVPPKLLLGAGYLFTTFGLAMLVFGPTVQRTIVKGLIVLVVALASAQVASSSLITPVAERLSMTTSLLRGGVALGGFTLDLQCTGSMLGIFVAARLAIFLVGLSLVERSMLFLEGAACGVLGVRLAANFYPPLLVESSVVPDAGFLLGYPIVPFWACAVPLAVVLGTFALVESWGELLAANDGAPICVSTHRFSTGSDAPGSGDAGVSTAARFDIGGVGGAIPIRNQTARINHTFQHFDRDNSGYLDRSELRAALRHYGIDERLVNQASIPTDERPARVIARTCTLY